MTWKPIINGRESHPFKEKISQLAQILNDKSHEIEDIGLLNGRMGIVLFLYYYARFSGEETFKEKGFQLIEGIFDQIETSEVPHTFCEGLAGIGWGLNHLIKQGFIEADIDDILAELDQFSSEVISRYIEDSNFDYLQGAVGIGLYLLGRLPGPIAMEGLQSLLDALQRQAVHSPDGTLHWAAQLDPSNGKMGCNLSLSHGISGIVGLLARMAAKEPFRAQAVPLIKGACGYLAQRQFQDPGFNSMFPGIYLPQEPPAYSRLAWCYGDLGVALGFSHTAEATGDEALARKAETILLHSARRKESQHTGVTDACVCHGSAGNSHIFNRGYQHHGNEALRETARYWLNQSLEHAKYPDGYAGYKMRHPEIKGGWQPEASLLEGIAGIGLVFMAALSDIEPAWDQCLMIG